MIRGIYLFPLFLFLLLSVRAQEPNHYFFGNERFAGVDIYDLIQDKQQRYWFATNQGLILHDGYSYRNIDCPEMTSLSLFNLRKDSAGAIYCYNLKGQIFQIVDDKVSLFYTISDAENQGNTFLETSGNTVFVLGTDLTVLNSEGEKEHPDIRLNTDKARIYLKTFGDDEALFLTQREAYLYKDQSVEKFPIRTVPNSEEIAVLSSWIQIGEKQYCIDQKTMNLFEFDKDKKTFSYVRQLEESLRESAIRTYRLKEQIWVTGNRNGIYVYDLQWNPLYDGKPIFTNHFISDAYVDDEGNMLLSTFDEGVIVLPELNQTSIQLPKGDRVSDFCAGNGSLFIGSSSGKIYNYHNSSLQLLYESPNQKPIECIAYWESENAVVFTSVEGFSIGRWNGKKLEVVRSFKGALKNAFFEEKVAYLALNVGVKRIVPVNGTYEEEKVASVKSRSYDLIRDPTSGTLFIAMSSGLHTLTTDHELNELKRNNSSIFATSLATFDDKIYAGTIQDGLLVFDGEQFVKQISIDIPVVDILSGQEFLFFQSIDGLYSYHPEQQIVLPINKSMGLHADVLSTVKVVKDRFMYAAGPSINQLTISQVVGDGPAIPLTFHGLFLDDQATSSQTLEYSTRKYTFRFGVSTLKFRENIRYRYKLIGYDENWEYLDYSNNSVSFKGLPAGDYEFVVQSLNGQTESTPVSYSFVITAPFYQQAWFFVLLIFIFLLLVTMIYLLRLKRIQRKNNQLVEQQKIKTDLLQMELKALRSQMNPHFIFNSLNSIQHLVLKEDTDNSYDYLVLFSKLVRSTLNYSDLNYIPIQKEIEFLNVYLKLEKLRFKKDLNYSIEYVGTDEVDVPPLILQPFVENALVHGLLHKEGDKSLTVNIRLEEHLVCEIVDNGIGREKAREIRERRSEHQSFAMKAIKQRLELLNKHSGQEVGHFAIEDLYDGDRSAGTKVTIVLPVMRKY